MLRVGDKAWSGELTPVKQNTIKAKIKTLGQPLVYPMNEVKIRSDDVVLCMQQEAAVIHQLATIESPQYLGSKYFSTCLMIYIHSETDHAILHIDENITDYLLPDLLKGFDNTDNVEVTLLGGFPNETSNKIYDNIIQQLFNAAKTTGINITINKQKILENNLYTDKDKLQAIYDYIAYKSRILYKNRFQEEPDREFLHDIKISDFDRRISIKNLEMLTAMIDFLTVIDSVMDNSSKQRYEILSGYFDIKVTNKRIFTRLLNEFISKEGMDLFLRTLNPGHKIRTVEATNYVIDLKTGNLHLIPCTLYTPNEMTRVLRSVDCLPSSGCTIIYDNTKSINYTVKTNDEFIDRCKKIVTNSLFIDKQIFLKILNNETLQHLFRYNQAKAYKCQPVSSAFFKSDKIMYEIFLPQEVESLSITAVLARLKEITGKEFSAKQRRHPEYSVDALLFCKDKKEVDKIIQNLDERKIYSNNIIISNRNYVCVPAINTKKNYETTLTNTKKI